MSFYVKKEKKMFLSFIPAILAIVVLVFFAISMEKINQSSRTEQAEILETAVFRTITECYALEGSYPPNIDYLVTNYGLTYESDDFFIDYKYIGANLRPDVTIIQRGD